MTQIAIVVYPNFTALDLIGPYEVLHRLPDTEVRFLWHETGPLTADSGVLMIGATHTFAETPAPDVVLVPGGPGCVEVARDEAVLAWLRRVHEGATWTTSVCSGSVVLAAAGLLDGKRATSHWSSLAALKMFGVTPVGDQRIVHEGTPSPPPASRPASTWACGWPVSWPGRPRPRPCSWASNTTRSHRSTPGTSTRPPRPPRPAPPRCWVRTWSRRRC